MYMEGPSASLSVEEVIDSEESRYPESWISEAYGQQSRLKRKPYVVLNEPSDRVHEDDEFSESLAALKTAHARSGSDLFQPALVEIHYLSGGTYTERERPITEEKDRHAAENILHLCRISTPQGKRELKLDLILIVVALRIYTTTGGGPRTLRKDWLEAVGQCRYLRIPTLTRGNLHRVSLGDSGTHSHHNIGDSDSLSGARIPGSFGSKPFPGVGRVMIVRERGEISKLAFGACDNTAIPHSLLSLLGGRLDRCSPSMTGNVKPTPESAPYGLTRRHLALCIMEFHHGRNVKGGRAGVKGQGITLSDVR
ncbi:hypothetical protein C8F04DRAFT_1199253 [Mycena alexandri]|uniref:Uncharacterized protein n=1 Tax=Mycena alexandri TaxID=1745969 RepID=A0AAD6WNR7_9AGAR|nr:hypothetical protein C8F04DRAFT_1199253 [Mycena alexandri]